MYLANRQKLMHRQVHHKNAHSRGVLLIEMAFILPVLIIVLVLAIDISRFMIVTMALNNAVDQGIVAGSNNALNLTTQTTWTNQIRSAITNSMSQYSWFNPAKLNVTIPTPSTSNGMIDSSGFRSIRVQISYQAEYVIPWQGRLRPDLVSLKLQTDQIR